MKKIILSIVLSSCVSIFLQAQIMHSPNNLEISIGAEGFRTFNPIFSDPGGNFFFELFRKEGDLRTRPVVTLSYRKTQSSGNNFGFSATYGRINWLEEDAEISTVDILGNPTRIFFDEDKTESTVGAAYIYSFLLTRDSPNLQFFIGTQAGIYNSSAKNIPLSFELGSRVRRNIFGIRISAVPELRYLFPDSRLVTSIRARLPLSQFEQENQDLRTQTFNSVFGGRQSRSFFKLAHLENTRIEIGIGYYLAAN